jgi:hypothetical protein
MKLGDTFLWTPGRCKEHLYIVVSITKGDPPSAVIMNLTGARGGAGACVLTPGDHPFITKNSDVNFGDALIKTVDFLDRIVASGEAISHATMKPELLLKIGSAGKSHPATPNDIRAILAGHYKL